jgi:predicted AlkP superfamily phosphohydrolase/phosphomutase
MIGLDAAELGFIRADLTSLPNLRRVLERGTLHPLRSPADRLTGSVWPTFYTASSPGHHGIYHHIQWDASAMRLRRLAPDWLPVEPFWNEFARRGGRVTTIDVPLLFPSQLKGAVEVLNWGSHDQLGPTAVHPRSLASELRLRFGKHPMGWEIPVGKTTAELSGIRDSLVRGARRKAALVRWLMESAPWDFLIATFGETHRGGHILWPDGPGGEAIPAGALRDVYRAVDAALGEVLASPSLEGAALIVFSLHGMGPNPSQEHFVPRVMDRTNALFAPASGDGSDRTAAAPRGIVRRLRESVPAWIQNRVAHAVPVSVRDAVVNRSIVAGHDWPRTIGFDLLSDMNGYLRWNLRGREAAGAVDRDGEVLARYSSWVRECFTSLRIAGDGRPLVESVELVSETFPGPRVDHLPDMVVRWAGHAPADRVESDVIGPVDASFGTGRSGNHRRDGFAVVSLPGAPARALEDIRDLASLARAVVA